MKLKTFDIETWGVKPGYTLMPWKAHNHESGILSIATSTGVDNTVIEGAQVDIKELFGEGDKNIICGWNLKFDLSFLCKDHLNVLAKYKYLDGMLLMRQMGISRKSYSLKGKKGETGVLQDYAMHIPSYVADYNADIEFKVGLPHEAYTEEELQKMLLYNERDANYTSHLINYLVRNTTQKILKQAIRESTVNLLWADAWQRGIYVDPKAINSYAKVLNKTIKQLDDLLSTVNLKNSIIASPKQLVDYLQNVLKIELTERTDKGSYSVKSDVLKKLYHETTGNVQLVLRAIIKYKQLKTEKNKFVNGAQECLKSGDTIHPEPMTLGTYTGRLKYSTAIKVKTLKKYKNGSEKYVNKKIRIGLPIHQIKKSTEIRNMFIAPPKHQLVELDFANQEMRLIACIANETTMIRLFNENKDLHAYTAAAIVGMKYEQFLELKKSDTKKYNEKRKLGKVTNLALQYRLGANGLYKQWHDKYELTDKTRWDAANARDAYLALYTGIKQYWETSPLNAQNRGYIESMGGRHLKLTEWSGENAYKSSQTAINFPIQATAADQKILALYELRNFLLKNDIKVAWDLHDAIFLYVPDHDMITETTAEMVEILSNLPYKKAWGWEPQVSFPVEAKIGKRWGELKELNI